MSVSPMLLTACSLPQPDLGYKLSKLGNSGALGTRFIGRHTLCFVPKTQAKENFGLRFHPERLANEIRVVT